MEITKNINIIELLEKTGGMLKGHFELSSGLHSNRYFQCAKLLQYTDIAEQIGKALAEQITEEVDVIVGPALGGMIIAHEVARALNKRSIFVERKDGIMCLRRGFEIAESERVFIVEDVITTAKSALEAAKVVEELGAKVIGFGCIVDRSQGKTGYNIKSLIKMDPEVYTADNCLMCRQGSLPVKPGSRTQK